MARRHGGVRQTDLHLLELVPTAATRSTAPLDRTDSAATLSRTDHDVTPASGEDVPTLRSRRPSISAVIPHRNSGPLLEHCVDALLAARDVDEIIVADEASTDGSVDARRGQAARADRPVGTPRLCRRDEHRGRAAHGDRLLLLNSDAFVRPDTVERLRSAAGRESAPRSLRRRLVERRRRPRRRRTRSCSRSARADRHVEPPAAARAGRARPRARAKPSSRPARSPGATRSSRSAASTSASSSTTRISTSRSASHVRAGSRRSTGTPRRCTSGGARRAAAPRSAGSRSTTASRLLYMQKHYPRGWVIYALFWAAKASVHVGTWTRRAPSTGCEETSSAKPSRASGPQAFRRASGRHRIQPKTVDSAQAARRRRA